MDPFQSAYIWASTVYGCGLILQVDLSHFSLDFIVVTCRGRKEMKFDLR
jgi:hypothetical protein